MPCLFPSARGENKRSQKTMDRQHNTRVESVRQKRRAARAMRQGDWKRANTAARHASRFTGGR